MCGKRLLIIIAHAAQIMQLYIQYLMRNTFGVDIESTLDTLLDCYGQIIHQAYKLGSQRGWDIPIVSIVRRLKVKIDMIHICGSNANSKAAALLTLRCIKASVKAMQALHLYRGTDRSLTLLLQRLNDAGKTALLQMEQYL